MDLLPRRLLLDDHGGLRAGAGLHRLAVLQRGVREPQHLVAFGEPAAQRERAACARRDRRASAPPSASFAPFTRQAYALSPSRTTDAPGRLSVALLRSRRGLRRTGRRRSAACFASSKATSTSTWRVVTLAAGFTRVITPVNSLVGEAVDAEPHVLAGLHLADAVGRHQAFETQAGRIDDLEQFLADLRGVAGRHLAVADDAVERRAHFGALELLARGDHARARGGAIALRGVAADLDVFELLRGHHAGLAQRLHALELALGLFVGLVGGARRRLGRGQACRGSRSGRGAPADRHASPGRRFP